LGVPWKGIKAPEGLIRFYSYPKFALDVLENRQIAFIRVTLLNDPFDPYGFFETEFKGYMELLSYVGENHAEDRGWFRTKVTAQSWGRSETDLRAYMDGLRRDTFVLCASAPAGESHPKDNLYMWGHYGNGHRGLAIEFDATALASAVLGHHSSQGGNNLLVGEQPWVQIKYAESFRTISAEDAFQSFKQEREVETRKKREREETSLDRYYHELSVIKSTAWQSENEWRIMWRSTTEVGNVYKIPITPECIRAVYLGLQCPRDDADSVVAAAAKNFPHAQIWHATKRHGDLALDFQLRS
jgi:hypothetical protein